MDGAAADASAGRAAGAALRVPCSLDASCSGSSSRSLSRSFRLISGAARRLFLFAMLSLPFPHLLTECRAATAATWRVVEHNGHWRGRHARRARGKTKGKKKERRKSEGKERKRERRKEGKGLFIRARHTHCRWKKRSVHFGKSLTLTPFDIASAMTSCCVAVNVTPSAKRFVFISVT